MSGGGEAACGACLDIGSNTTRLLVAERTAAGGLAARHELRAFTRIGAAMGEGTTIPAATCAAVADVVAEQHAAARAHGATTVRAVATAAVRRADNAAALVAAVRGACGLEVAVLSAADEARLAFRGAAETWPAPVPTPLGVLDVGGGSSEVIVGDAPGTLAWWTSLAVGSGSLATRHLGEDPPGARGLAAARAEVVAALDTVAWEGPAPALTLAVGGSATSLVRLTGPELTVGRLDEALVVLAGAPAAAVAARFGIDPERARLLPAGLTILRELALRLGGPVRVGRGGIREGVLLEALAR